MRRIVLLVVLLMGMMSVHAQRYKVLKSGSQLYINHTIAAKETLYSLGRMYHLSPKVIAQANKMKADAGLTTGKKIKIPLKKENFVQHAAKGNAALEPVYYTIKKGDNLSRVSKGFNKVKEADLKKWNNLKKNMVKPGQELIIGFLKVSDESPAVATEPPSKPHTTRRAPETSKPSGKEVDSGNTSTSNRKPMPVVATTDDTARKTVVPETEKDMSAAAMAPDESYFAANYSVNAGNAQEKKITGTAATFKSTSGWTDKKYYVLISEVSPETIVKITANGKTVYAKVLEALPDLKDNKNVLCRISNAAASVLGITDAKFEVEIAFYE